LSAVWFFHEHEIGAALADTILLWAVAGLATLVFDQVATSAAWHMLSYWAWLTFAAYLNIGFWRFNR
jgi:translocator protein